MQGATLEIEIKLSCASVDDARERLERIGARAVAGRLFEDNVVLDRTDGGLHAAGELLRVRSCGERSWITWKRPVASEARMKVREELETALGDATMMLAILERLGFHAAYRYQKYRTRFEHDSVEICLDETPIGCFLELEGPARAIDHVAAALGFTPDQYVRESYLELHERAAAARGTPRGDLLFAEPAGGRPEARR